MQQHLPWLPVKKSDSVRVKGRTDSIEEVGRDMTKTERDGVSAEGYAEAVLDNSHRLLVI